VDSEGGTFHRVFDWQGNALTGNIAVPRSPYLISPTPFERAAVVGLAHGGYAILWTGEDADGRHVYQTVYDGRGNALNQPQFTIAGTSAADDLVGRVGAIDHFVVGSQPNGGVDFLRDFIIADGDTLDVRQIYTRTPHQVVYGNPSTEGTFGKGYRQRC